ncbi:reverse transcriptase domain-containing protein [Tanacetum coccineum]
MEKSINQSNLESCDSIGDKFDNDLDLGNPIRRINPVKTPYSVAKEIVRYDGVESEHRYLANANKIDEKKPELKDLPHHLEYAYLHGDKSFPIIISSELSEKDKMLLLNDQLGSFLLKGLEKSINQSNLKSCDSIGYKFDNDSDLGNLIWRINPVLEKREGAVVWKMLNMKGINPSLCTYKILIEDDLSSSNFKKAFNPNRNDQLDSFLLKGLEKLINQSNLESYDSIRDKFDNDSDLGNPIRHINPIDEKKPELEDLPHHLEYAYLHGDKSFPIIISSKLSVKEKMLLLQVLEKHEGAVAWKMSNIKGISLSLCTHKILMEDEFKPVIQPKRHLNPKVQDIVKNEIVKLLDSGLIYLISDSSWVSPIHVFPKKGGMTVVLMDNNELIPFSNSYKILRFIHIPIAPEDQEKTTFTYPYGTFSYRKMSFGLCNAPATFQRCMTAIFHDMVEDFIEVFMDDLLIFGNSFNCCLANLDKMLARCEETNLVLN